MTSALNITGQTQGAFSAPPAAVVSANATGAAAPAADTTKPITQNSTTAISPRIVVDPYAGPITEFLSSSGQVQLQIPSAAAVAYLRAGLDANGYAKPDPTTGQNKHHTSVA